MLILGNSYFKANNSVTTVILNKTIRLLNMYYPCAKVNSSLQAKVKVTGINN